MFIAIILEVVAPQVMTTYIFGLVAGPAEVEGQQRRPELTAPVRDHQPSRAVGATESR